VVLVVVVGGSLIRLAGCGGAAAVRIMAGRGRLPWGRGRRLGIMGGGCGELAGGCGGGGWLVLVVEGGD
jgi:hypothetical protein